MIFTCHLLLLCLACTLELVLICDDWFCLWFNIHYNCSQNTVRLSAVWHSRKQPSSEVYGLYPYCSDQSCVFLLWCQWTVGSRCRLVLNFPINYLVPQPLLHLAQQAVSVQQGPMVSVPMFDRPKWDVLAGLYWNWRVFTDEDWVDWHCCVQWKLSLGWLALSSPSFVCAKAGIGWLGGGRRTRAGTGSQQR